MFTPFTQPGFLIRRLHQVSVRLFQNHVASFGVSPVQFGALQVVQERPGIGQRSLAEATDIDATTAVRVVGRLQALGLLRKIGSSTDRRASQLHVTEAGGRLLATVAEFAEHSQRQLLDPLSPQARADFLEMVRTIVLAHTATEPAPDEAGPPIHGAERPRPGRSARTFDLTKGREQGLPTSP